MEDYQKKFLELSLQAKVLEFGDFILKSGRKSPYFFNSARMLNGGYLYELANCYKQAIDAANEKERTCVCFSSDSSKATTPITSPSPS